MTFSLRSLVSRAPRALAILLAAIVGLLGLASPARADVDPYVDRFLDAREPVAVAADETGAIEQFSAEDLSDGWRFFQDSCLSCHVGGATVQDPTVSLSLDDLHGATPPRDTVAGFVAYMRHPTTYDGTDDTFWCREVPESWLSDRELKNLAAFVLRAAEVSPGWGTQAVQFE